MRESASFIGGTIIALLLLKVPKFTSPHAGRVQGGMTQKVAHHQWRPCSLRDAGNLADAKMLARALHCRASLTGEIIFMLADERSSRSALNLLLNLDQLQLRHHLVIASSPAACTVLWRRARWIGNLSLGCGHSTFLQRGSNAAIDAGLAAYGIEDEHVYHLWWQRWFFLSEAVALGYRVLSLDTDLSVRADPYPLLHGPLAHHTLLTGLDTDQPTMPFCAQCHLERNFIHPPGSSPFEPITTTHVSHWHRVGTLASPADFPPINVGFVYAHGGAGSPTHWVLTETRRRVQSFLVGEAMELPKRRGRGQMSLWDQDTFKDVLETAAFSPSNASYRHAMLHAKSRYGGPPPHRLATSLPDGWAWRIEGLRFFGNVTAALPSLWLPLHLPRAAISLPSGPGKATSIPTTEHGALLTNDESAVAGVANGSFGALPLWFFSTYLRCPHGGICDGRWGWRRPPIVIGHLVGTKVKFWLLRLLGWWHYRAARPLLPEPTAAEHNEGAFTNGSGPIIGPEPPVFSPTLVRPLVIRGHQLGPLQDPRRIRTLRQQLVRLTLLAIALGRRAVMPIVPCKIPVPETPPSLRGSTAIVKLTNTQLCDVRTMSADWRMEPTVPPLRSVSEMSKTPEMSAIGDYTGITSWPPRQADSCCQMIPAIKCIDQYGISAWDLQDEMYLNERDLGWIAQEESGAVGQSTIVGSSSHRRTRKTRRTWIGAHAPNVSHTIRPRRPMALEELQRLSFARTLVIDLSHPQAGRTAGRGTNRSRWLRNTVADDTGDPLALLPPRAIVLTAVQAIMERSRVSSASGMNSRPRGGKYLSHEQRMCVDHLMSTAQL